jgi:hypothetical protein
MARTPTLNKDVYLISVGYVRMFPAEGLMHVSHEQNCFPSSGEVKDPSQVGFYILRLGPNVYNTNAE